MNYLLHQHLPNKSPMPLLISPPGDRGTTIVKSIAICFLLSLSPLGCSQLSPKAEINNLQIALSERIGQSVEFHWTDAMQPNQKNTPTPKSQHELSLDDASRIALSNNPTLHATLEEIGIAQAQLTQTSQLRNPTVSLSYKPVIASGSGTEIEYSVLQDMVDLLLQPLRKQLADQSFQTIKLRVTDEVLKLLAQVKAAYYTLQAGQHSLALERLELETIEASTELSKRLYQAGNVNELDLITLQAALEQFKLEVAKTRTQWQADRETLQQLMGLDEQSSSWTIAPNLPPSPDQHPPLDNLLSCALDRRPDLQASKHDLEMLELALKLNKNQAIVTEMNLGLAGKKEIDGAHQLGPSIAFEFPIFNQGQTRIARSQARLRQAEHRHQALLLDIQSQIRLAHSRMLNAGKAAASYQNLVLPLHDKALSLSQKQYNGMFISAFDLLQTRKNRITSEHAYIETLRDYWIARSELEYAVGGRLPPSTSEPITKNIPSASIPIIPNVQHSIPSNNH